MSIHDVHIHQPVDSDTHTITSNESVAESEKTSMTSDTTVAPGPDAQASSPIPDPGEAAFIESIVDINELDDDDIAPYGADPIGSAGRVLAASIWMAPFRDQMVQLPGFRPDWADKLATYARALVHAKQLEDEPVASPELIFDCAQHRKRMLAMAEVLVLFGRADADRVAAIRKGWGHRDMADDLIALSRLYRDNWERVKIQGLVTREMVERAGALGYELHERLGGLRPAYAGLTPDLSPKAVRHRVWTLMVVAYNECRRALEYLAPDRVDEIAPSLFIKQRRAEVEEVAEVESAAAIEPADPPKPANEGGTSGAA